MKTCISLLSLLFLFQFSLSAQTEFVLDPYQSMLMTGKGPGQDGTINPYDGKDCYAIIENIGERAFYVRVQKGETILQELTVNAGTLNKVKLLAGNALYLDPNPKGIAKARVSYEKFEN